MSYRQSDIVLVLFPNSDLLTAKHRPALVIQTENLGTGLNQTIVAMVTSNLDRADHPSRVSVDLTTAEGKKSGLLLPSVIMTDNVATILNSAIDRKLGTWTNMKAVEVALLHTFGIPVDRL